MGGAAARGRRGLIALAALWLLAAPAAAADYDDGLTAFQAGDYEKARRVWTGLAEQGDAAAQYGLGVLYERGAGPVVQDAGRAVAWYRRAAEQGVAAAQNNLALMYSQGRGVMRDPGRAAGLWQQAADGGHPMAQYNLGLAYYRGDGVEKNVSAAVRWFRRAAEAGLADAQYGLAQMYRLGVGVGPDDGLALAWYRRAAEQGHDRAREQARALARAGAEAKPLPEPAAPAAEPSAPAVEPEPAEPAEAAGRSGPETASEPEAAGMQTAAATAGDEPGPAGGEAPAVVRGARGVHVWLGSAEDRAAAAARWRELRAASPRALAEVPARLQEVERAGGGMLYRVLGGPLDSPERARGLCRRLRQSAPGTFCKVLKLEG